MIVRRFARITMSCWVLLAAALCFAQSPSQQAGSEVPVASVAGQPILEGDLAPLVEGQLRQLQYQEYMARRKALDDLINQRLVAAKAKEQGLTPDEFLRQNVDSKLPEPSEADVKAYYLHQRNLSNLPFAQVKAQLANVLKQQNAERARQDYFAGLRQSADVVIMLRPPKVWVSEESTRALGKPDAPVTIVEFADFECPFCRQAAPVMRELLSKYNDKVRLVFRDFPLEEIHPGTQRAAEAARCAAAQGKFWAYHDLLFANPAALTDEDLRQHAHSLKLDGTQFDACLQRQELKAEVEEDIKAGTQAGVSGTPAFFINGVFFNGLQPLSTFEKTIDEELAEIKNKQKTPAALNN